MLTDFVSPIPCALAKTIFFSPSLLIHFAGEHTGVFIFVHSLSLDFKSTTTRGSVDVTIATSDTATVNMMETSGHADDNDSNEQHGGDDDQDKDEVDTTTRQRATHQR
jgi:hypothetical protein